MSKSPSRSNTNVLSLIVSFCLQVGSRGQLAYYSWALQGTQFVLLNPQVGTPGKTISNYLLCFRTEEHPCTDSGRQMGTYKEEDKLWLLAHAGVLIWNGPVHNARRGANQRCTSLLKRVGLVVVWTLDDNRNALTQLYGLLS